jgi:hypothetical protein
MNDVSGLLAWILEKIDFISYKCLKGFFFIFHFDFVVFQILIAES